MTAKRKIEIYSAGCPLCEETAALVKETSCPSCDIAILDMRRETVAARARKLGIRSVPAVAIDGKLAGCCAGRGPDIATLNAAGVGTRLE
jgi:glutaredoxin 3